MLTLVFVAIKLNGTSSKLHVQVGANEHIISKEIVSYDNLFDICELDSC